MYELIENYGNSALGWVLAGLGLLLSRYVWIRIGNDYALGVLTRAWGEVRAAVAEVGQTYVAAIKAGRADGKLTDEEKAVAKSLAIAAAKRNLGAKGLRALARILGLDSVDEWLAGRLEAAVAEGKAAGVLDPPKAISLPR